MYVCGMTVYDYCHLGHARVLVIFDVVRRWLQSSSYRVTYVRNITDIDDKIIRRAAENGEPVGALTERFIRAMDEDAAALGVAKPDHEPRATQFVQPMVEMIGRLEEKDLAYQSATGDVNYAVRRFPGYGKLSGKSLDELRAGERVDVDASKEDPLDFVLWKRSKPGEPTWKSPWGGRSSCAHASGATINAATTMARRSVMTRASALRRSTGHASYPSELSARFGAAQSSARSAGRRASAGRGASMPRCGDPLPLSDNEARR
jgi:cysteinyl-tRNA synthetase